MYKNSDALLYIFREPGETNQSKRALKSNSLMFSQQEIFLRQNWMNVKIKEELFWEKNKTNTNQSFNRNGFIDFSEFVEMLTLEEGGSPGGKS